MPPRRSGMHNYVTILRHHSIVRKNNFPENYPIVSCKGSHYRNGICFSLLFRFKRLFFDVISIQTVILRCHFDSNGCSPLLFRFKRLFSVVISIQTVVLLCYFDWNGYSPLLLRFKRLFSVVISIQTVVLRCYLYSNGCYFDSNGFKLKTMQI